MQTPISKDIPEVQIPKDMLALAEHILDSKAADFDASKFHDRYEASIVAMLNEKKAGLPVSVQRQIPRIVAGTDLMAALRQSIESEGKPAAPAAKETPAAKPTVPKGKKAAKRNPDQREMLLPIAGGGPAKEVTGQTDPMKPLAL
jgi:DNA end-binding protein Ku